MKRAIILCCLAMALTGSAGSADNAKPAAAGTAQATASADMVKQKMEKIIFSCVDLENANIFIVIRFLNRSGKHYDPDATGITVVSGINKQDMSKLPKFTLKANQVSFAKLLDQLKLNYKIDEGAIVILPGIKEDGK